MLVERKRRVKSTHFGLKHAVTTIVSHTDRNRQALFLVTLPPMVLLEPELEDGVDESVRVTVFLYDVLLNKRLLVPADGLWGT